MHFINVKDRSVHGQRIGLDLCWMGKLRILASHVLCECIPERRLSRLLVTSILKDLSRARYLF